MSQSITILFRLTKIRGVYMELADYSTADITRTYYYTLLQDAYTSEEYVAKNKQELEAAIKTGKVFSYRVEINKFYFKNREENISNG